MPRLRCRSSLDPGHKEHEEVTLACLGTSSSLEPWRDQTTAATTRDRHHAYLRSE